MQAFFFEAITAVGSYKFAPGKPGKWEKTPMSGVSRVAFLLAGCLLAGCSSLRTDVRSEAPPGYQADAASKAASVNWSKVQTVSVGMDEYDYVPSSLNFEVACLTGCTSRTAAANRTRFLPSFLQLHRRAAADDKGGYGGGSFHKGTRRGVRTGCRSGVRGRWLQEITRWCVMNCCMRSLA